MLLPRALFCIVLFCVICVFCLLVVLVRLSVAVQMIDWKDSSPKRPIEWLCERTEHLHIFLFLPITQWCSFPMFSLLVEGECQILVF